MNIPLKFAPFLQVTEYLQENPFTAKQTPENEIAYERLMDVRLKLLVSFAFFYPLWAFFQKTVITDNKFTNRHTLNP